MNNPRISGVWILCDLGHIHVTCYPPASGPLWYRLGGVDQEGEVSGVQAPKDHLILNLEYEREVVEVPLGSLCGRRRSTLHSNQRRAALLELISSCSDRFDELDRRVNEEFTLRTM